MHYLNGISSLLAGQASNIEVESIIGDLIVNPAFKVSSVNFIQEICKIDYVVTSKLFNAPISDGHFPEILKVVRVISIFKSRLREIIFNYGIPHLNFTDTLLFFERLLLTKSINNRPVFLGSSIALLNLSSK